MPNIFLCADHHLYHEGVIKFFRADGITPLRVFDNIHHMNEYIIYKHNLVVKPEDKVYFLGDVMCSKKATQLDILQRMNGEKILIKGNHDYLSLTAYQKYFKDVRGSYQLDGMLLTHIPIHPGSLSRWSHNIHGHLHSNVVLDHNNHPDPRYFCVSMEHLDDYTPISLEQINKQLKRNK